MNGSTEPPAGATIAERIQLVEERMAAACRRAGRGRDSVTLVAVSKTRGPEEIIAAIEAGVGNLGENRPEEADEKITLVREMLQGSGVAFPEWHMIGHIQSRKAPLVVGRYSLIHSLDSFSLGQRLARLAEREGRVLDVLLQVNVSGEDSKGGWVVRDCRVLPESFARDLDALAGLPAIRLRGLMTIPPASDDPQAARPHFQSLRRLRDLLSTRVPAVDWSQLSMGMTDDFEVAIEEESTLVRVGRAIFGPRTA